MGSLSSPELGQSCGVCDCAAGAKGGADPWAEFLGGLVVEQAGWVQVPRAR